MEFEQVANGFSSLYIDQIQRAGPTNLDTWISDSLDL